MINEALQDDEEEKRDYFSFKSLLTLGIATSIDALAIGVSFALLPINILMAISMIGIITTVLCLAGVYIGARF
jgi:putative Mn2+ efflux pump MntP